MVVVVKVGMFEPKERWRSGQLTAPLLCFVGSVWIGMVEIGMISSIAGILFPFPC